MSVFRPYPNQQPRTHGLAPIQTAASGFYPFEGSTRQQINRGMDIRAVLPALGIAALLAPAPVFVPPATASSPAAYVRMTAAPQLPAAGPASTDDTVLVVCGEPTQSVAAFIRAPSPPAPQFTSAVAPLAQAPGPVIPPSTLARPASITYPPIQLPESEIAPLLAPSATVAPPATVQGALARAAMVLPLQIYSAVTPLAQSSPPYIPAVVLARTPPVIYPAQIIEYDVAQFLTGAADAPPPIAPGLQAAYMRSISPAQQPENEIAPLLPQGTPLVFATLIPIPTRETRALQIALTPYTPAATVFIYTAPTPLLGLYARLAFAWPRIPVHAAALIPPAPLAPLSDVRIRFSSGGPERLRFSARGSERARFRAR
jgi:hypothetical protein